VPALRVSESVFAPPWKVGVCPSTDPEEEARVRLWDSGAEFVKSIVTVPAFAVRELALNFSWPSGLAARLKAPAAPAGVLVVVAAGLLAVAGAVVAVADGLAGALAEFPVPLEELPQPVAASTSGTSSARVDLRMSGLAAAAAASIMV
jgi:hypothetical protein